MVKLISSLFFFSLILTENLVLSSKAIVFPLKYSHPNEPNQFEPNQIISYYAKNDIYTYLKMGSNKHDLTIVFDDDDSSFILKNGFCPIESDYSIANSETFKYDQGITYIYINNELVPAMNNTRDKIYLNQANKEYFYSSMKDRRFLKNINQIEIKDFSFLYSPENNEVNDLNKRKQSKDDDYNDYRDDDDNPFTPYYPGDDNDHTNDDFNYPKCGYMGLLPQSPTAWINNAKMNFIQQLKNKKIIDNYNWYIRYNKDKTGELIIGAAPHEVRPENYLEEDLYMTHAKLVNDLFYWEIAFTSIELFDENSNKRYNMEKVNGVLSINTNFIYAPKSFYENIAKIFFNHYFELNICKKERINQYESLNDVIYCHQRNFTDKDLKKFPVLLFQSNELNYIFNLDYNDLFIKTRNVYIFKIINNFAYDYWKLGKTFLEKYQFVFNYDSKTFGFYRKFVPENINGDLIINSDTDKKKGNDKLPPSIRKELRDKENKSKANNHTALKIVLIIGLIILIVLIVFYIVRKFVYSKQVNSHLIENYQKYGKKGIKDDDLLDNIEEIN